MNEKDIFSAMGGIDPQLIEENAGVKRARRRPGAAAVIAACLALLLLAGTMAYLGAAERASDMPLFYAVDGRLYRRATDAAAIMLGLLPASCGKGEKGEAQAVQITEEALASDTEPAGTEPGGEDPDNTDEPQSMTVTINANGLEISCDIIWASTDGSDFILTGNTAYRSCKYAEIMYSCNFKSGTANSVTVFKDGEEALTDDEGRAAESIFASAESIGGSYFYEMVFGVSDPEKVQELLDKTDSVELKLVLEKDGRTVTFIMTYYPEYGIFKDHECFFELTEENAAELNGLLGIGR